MFNWRYEGEGKTAHAEGQKMPFSSTIALALVFPLPFPLDASRYPSLRQARGNARARTKPSMRKMQNPRSRSMRSLSFPGNAIRAPSERGAILSVERMNLSFLDLVFAPSSRGSIPSIALLALGSSLVGCPAVVLDGRTGMDHSPGDVWVGSGW